MCIRDRPKAQQALRKAMLELDMVSWKLTKDALKVTDLFKGDGPEQVSFRKMNRHFAMADLPAGQARTSLDFIRQTFANMHAILIEGPPGGGNPWGANIVESDPLTKPPADMKDAIAYSPNQTADPKRLAKLGISPWRIYFTKLIDGKSEDFFVYAIMHELAHFVDEEKKAPIKDHAYGHQARYQTLPHYLRKLNADCYALLAFEYWAGQDRMRAIYPNLPIELYRAF